MTLSNNKTHRLINQFLAGVLLFGVAGAGWAEGKYIDVAPRDVDQVQLVLSTLNSAITQNDTDTPPIVMMLHGPTAHLFMRGNYAEHRALVDSTAALSAHGVLRVQVCEVWLENNGYTSKDLFPFISPVPYGVAELERLSEKEGYTEYSIDL